MAPSPAFGPRGEALHVALLAVKQYNPAEMVLVVEVCRMADRLEQFNEMITSRGLIDLMQFRRVDEGVAGEATIKVTVDGVVAEARQLQLAFQRVAMALNIESGAMPEAEVDLGDDLAKQRADRIARATG